MQVTQSHISAGINETQHLLVDLLSPNAHVSQYTVPAFIGMVQHLTYSIHGLLD